jgi:flavin-dependent dehydrogenase
MMRTPEPDLELKDQFTYQVRRSSFDAMLLDEARSRGAEFLAGRATTPRMSDDGTTLAGVDVQTVDGKTVSIDADITLDCTGQASFLANKGVTGPKYLGAYDKQIAIFGGVSGYRREDGEDRSRQPGNTQIFYTKKYHWGWAIPIDADITSIGIVVPAEYFRSKHESREDFFVREMRELNVPLAARCEDAVLAEEVHVIPNYSFQVAKFAGPGFLCVGDSHRFIDPIFSFGLYVSMKEAGIAADAVERYLGSSAPDRDKLLHDHMVETERAIDILEDVLDTFWENPLAFSVFVHDRYRWPMVDVFAGRLYDGMPHKGRDEALRAFRKLLKRERTYDDVTLFSMPIGSRFHPERAPLWNSELDDVETTERWMRELVS